MIQARVSHNKAQQITTGAWGSEKTRDGTRPVARACQTAGTLGRSPTRTQPATGDPFCLRLAEEEGRASALRTALGNGRAPELETRGHTSGLGRHARGQGLHAPAFAGPTAAAYLK